MCAYITTYAMVLFISHQSTWQNRALLSFREEFPCICSGILVIIIVTVDTLAASLVTIFKCALFQNFSSLHSIIIHEHNIKCGRNVLFHFTCSLCNTNDRNTLLKSITKEMSAFSIPH